MNKREAKVLALETFANNVEILIESVGVSGAIRTPKDCDLINAAFDELADSLQKRADKLKSNKKNEKIIMKEMIFYLHGNEVIRIYFEPSERTRLERFMSILCEGAAQLGDDVKFQIID